MSHTSGSVQYATISSGVLQQAQSIYLQKEGIIMKSTNLPRGVSRGLCNQRGYSLIELGIALSILSVIVVGSLVGVQSILSANRTNEMLKAMPSYMANAVKVTSSQPEIGAITTLNLIDLGVFPVAKVAGAAATRVVSNEHGGQVHLRGNAAAIGNYAAGQTFVLSLTNIPQPVCADVASGLDSIAYAMNIESSNANTIGTVAAASLAKPANNPTVAIAAVATACGAAGAKRITIAVPRG